MVFIVTELYYHHNQLYNICITPTKNRLAVTLYFSLVPQPLATSNLLSVSMDLPFLNTFYKWNHTICGLFYLASFIEHNVFKVPPCYSMYKYLFLVMAE